MNFLPFILLFPWIFFDQGTLHLSLSFTIDLLFHGTFVFHVKISISSFFASFCCQRYGEKLKFYNVFQCLFHFLGYLGIEKEYVVLICVCATIIRWHVDIKFSYKKAIFHEFPNVLFWNQFMLIEHKAIESKELLKNKVMGLFYLLACLFFFFFFLKKDNE